MFRDKINIDYGVSIKEIAAALNVTETRARSWLVRFRDWVINRSLLVYSVRNAYGQILYYNIQSKKTWEEIKARKARIIGGMNNLTEKGDEIIKMSKKQRDNLTNKTVSQVLTMQIENSVGRGLPYKKRRKRET